MASGDVAVQTQPGELASLAERLGLEGTVEEGFTYNYSLNVTGTLAAPSGSDDYALETNVELTVTRSNSGGSYVGEPGTFPHGPIDPTKQYVLTITEA